LLRWAVGFAVVFALGVFTSHFTVTLPLRAELAAQKDQLLSIQSQLEEVSSQLERSQAQLAELRTELSSAKSDIEVLQGELDVARLHVALFSALADVTRARLALALNETDAARQLLANTPQTLNQIATYLEAKDAQTVQALSERLAQVLDELDSNTFAAQSDLDVLANDLIQLEKQYFSSP
jgi:septal ring factor EnvC (AmiA/AmiB activator)